MVEEGSCSSGCPAEDFVLLCSLAMKGAVQKVPLTSHNPHSVGVQVYLTGAGFGQYRDAYLPLRRKNKKISDKITVER